MRTILVVLTAVLVLSPFVQAHGAAAPRAQDTRLLHDHNDDCGGDGVTANCRGTLDLIALDVQEFWEADTEKVRFRLTMDKGQSGSHKITISYDTPSGKKTLETTTTDQATFSGGFDKLSIVSANDGTRFILEAVTTSEKAGLTVNSKISNFRVEARRDNNLGDYMPGGYQGTLGPVQDPAQGDGPTNYVRPEYPWRGPGHYVYINGPDATGSGSKASTTLQLQNNLDAAQTVTIKLSTDKGSAKFTGGSTEKVLDVARRGTTEFTVEAEGAADGKILITATTNLGGKTYGERTFTIASSGVDGTTGDTTSDNPTGEPEGAPMPSAVALLGVLLAVALITRRRT